MVNRIQGLHHITAIAGKAKRNYDFYSKVLGLRFLKKTVNFDDPGTYHFYFGDEAGTPGTILTFFPWQNITRGKQGTGMVTEFAYAIPPDSIPYWQDRFKSQGVKVTDFGERFGEKFIAFEDPDGLPIALTEPKVPDRRKPWTAGGIQNEAATRGFHSISLSLTDTAPTAEVLTEIFGYRPSSKEGQRERFTTDAIAGAAAVDLITSTAPRGVNAGGTVHHVAFRVPNEEVLMDFREKVVAFGLSITPKIDRNYFFSLYFREPGGVLFEIATDNPGFTVDESLEDLGKQLKLPKQYESMRERIESILPSLD